MKKKLVIILSFIIAIVLCVPSVPALADDVIKIYSYDIVSSALGEHDNGEFIYGWDYTENNKEIAVSAVEKFKEDYPDVTNFIGMFSGNEVQFYTSTAPINVLFGGDIHYTNYDQACGFYTSFSNIDVYRYIYDSNNDSLNSAFLYTFLTISQNGNTYRWQFAETQRDVFAFEGDIHFYSLDELNEGGILNTYLSNNSIPNSATPETMMRNVLIDYDYSQLFDYADTSLPYYNGTQVVDPNGSVVETNLNHMYFNSCQLGFCEPYGVSSFNSFGGAYFYAKYSVDEWVRNHITDYSLYFYATAYVDSRQYSGNIEVRLDNDGCITIPFSDIFTTDGGVISDGFLAYISPNLVEQSFYDTSLYSVNKEQLQSFVDQRNLSSQDDWDRFWQDLYTLNSGQPVGNPGFGAIGYLSSNFSALLNGTISPSIINSINNHTNFKIHVNCYLKDNSGNVSGTVGKMFDLKVGNNFSTNNDGLTNNDPYIETDLPSDYVPSIICDSNGYSLSDIGNNNQIVNFSTPDQIKLFIDNGFKQFLTWYETSADTAYASNRFWSSMGIFEDNPATELYSEYFGFLPDDFKTLIFSCAGIGIVGGAYCILRRRLH